MVAAEAAGARIRDKDVGERERRAGADAAACAARWAAACSRTTRRGTDGARQRRYATPEADADGDRRSARVPATARDAHGPEPQWADSPTEQTQMEHQTEQRREPRERTRETEREPEEAPPTESQRSAAMQRRAGTTRSGRGRVRVRMRVQWRARRGGGVWREAQKAASRGTRTRSSSSSGGECERDGGAQRRACGGAPARCAAGVVGCKYKRRCSRRRCAGVQDEHQRRC